MGATILQGNVKPEMWPVEPALVAPEWEWFHDGSVKYLFLYWSGIAQELIHDILPDSGAGNIIRILTKFGAGVDHSNKVDFSAPIIGPHFAPGTGGFTVVSFGDPPSSATRETMACRRAALNNKHVELRTNSNLGGGSGNAGRMGFIVNNGNIGGTAGGAETDTSAVDGNFHVYVGRRANDGACSIWVDGIDRTTTSTSTTDDHDGAIDFALGGLPDSAAIPYLNIKLFDVWVDRAWSDSEIRQFGRVPFGPFRMADEIPVVGTLFVFTSANLALHHSGVSDIGGAIGAALTDDALNNIWDDVSSADATAGDTEFRCTYVKNTHATLSVANVKVEISTDPAESNWEIALGAAGKNGTETAVADEDTAPATPVFGTTALDLGTLAAGDFFPIWIKRIVSVGAGAATPDSGVLNILGDDPN